jgi:hypothetical protein
MRKSLKAFSAIDILLSKQHLANSQEMFTVYRSSSVVFLAHFCVIHIYNPKKLAKHSVVKLDGDHDLIYRVSQKSGKKKFS